MSTWNEQIKIINELRRRREADDEQLYAAQISLRISKGRDDQKYKQAKAALESSKVQLQNAINAIYTDAHPRSAITKLSDKVPFLLMPVRIETRFITAPSPELWLRIYPDDIAIHTHEKLLTDAETKDGRQYWTSLAETEEQPDAKKAAWNQIASQYGSQRAAWIIRQTKPVNWEQLTTPNENDQLVFPENLATKPSAWTKAPRTYDLPDKFVVMLYEGDVIVKEVTGEIIPDELYVGPDPMEADDAFVTVEGMVEFGESFDWTSNFEKAVKSGMGFKIPLTPQQATSGFDKIMVMGLSLSTDALQGQKNLETLFDNHHYSSKGLGIVKQGTATNNTDPSPSGYTPSDPFNERSYSTEAADPLFSDDSEKDGRNLAYLLGINYETFRHIENAGGEDLRESVAMNTALYPSTLGYYFSTLLSPVLTEPVQQRLQDFFIPTVTGRGPLPAIRVGNQPYGILLTSDYSKWQWTPEETGKDYSLLTGLQKVLDSYSHRWKELATQVMYTGKPGSNPSEVFMNILGLQASSVFFNQRIAYSTDDLKNRADFQGAGDFAADVAKSVTSKNNVMAFFSGLGYDIVDADGNPRVPQLLRLVYQYRARGLNAANLIDDRPLSETEPIHPTGEKNYIQWLLDATTVEVLRQRNFGEGIEAPTALLFLQLLRSFLLTLHAGSNDWFQAHGISIPQTRAAANFHNIRSADLTKWEVMKARVGIAVADHPQPGMAAGDYLLSADTHDREAENLRKMKEALGILVNLPTARLERCFTEHIDCCSYRLDAWQSAFFQRRLEYLRGANEQRAMGIYTGAFGWVEDVRPSSKRKVVHSQEPLYEYADNGGFVHTPSLNHAITAAILRSGYLNHASSADPELMAVNLSSQRVRKAKEILEGISGGQGLDALLGYQFERGLHDRGSLSNSMKPLNAYIYDFRKKFPLQRHIVLQQGATTATQTIPANDVVDGLALAEYQGDFPYGATGDVAGATGALKDAVIAEKEKLADTLDAVKDLLFSESIYQLVQGNSDRSAAIMNALKDTAVVPEPAILHTPRSSRFTYTMRVAVQFDEVADTDGLNPRAMMEPGINKWLGGILGELSALVFRVSLDDGSRAQDITVADLDIEPIDLVYIAGDELNTGSGQPGQPNSTAASELETRVVHVYRNSQGLDEDSLVRISFMKLQDLLPLLRMLKSLITGSRSLHAQDYIPASQQFTVPVVNPKGYNADELRERVEKAFDLFSGFADQLEIPGANPSTLLTTLIAVSGFGLTDSFPKVSAAGSEEQKQIIIEQAKSVAARMSTITGMVEEITSADNPADDPEKRVGQLTGAVKLLFGEVFNVLPVFSYRNAGDIQQCSNDRDILVRHAREELKMNFPAEEWLQQIAHVRPRLATLDGIATLSEINSGPSLPLTAVQLPYRESDSWIAIEFPAESSAGVPFTITQDTLSIAIHGEAAFASTAPQRGLLIDEVVETIPGKDEVTGLAFNYNQPAALPPQALLLAVAPQQKGNWDWDELVGVVNDTLQRAKQRAVEPDILNKSQLSQIGVLLPAILANFSTDDIDLALDYAINVDYYARNSPVNVVKL